MWNSAREFGQELEAEPGVCVLTLLDGGSGVGDWPRHVCLAVTCLREIYVTI